MKNNPRPLTIKGTISCEGGAKPKLHETTTAYALADAGYNVRFIPSSTIIGLADIYINNTIFEMKAPEGSTTKSIERNIVKAVHHQSGNIVIDTIRMKNVRDKSVQSFLVERLREGKGIQRILFVNRKREVIDINALMR
ncbi:hypothetical protein IKL45_00585 [Candidatus Saccharibacteria bacterium]|nr:hypothetical protein [Candidatus Saccharibacteria bacterium]MBR6122930.1 hypothetical protein [Candidatus Saccharibacteria bacterium]